MATKNKKNYLRYIAIAVMVVLFVAACLMLLQMWEKRNSRFPVINKEDGIVTYKGEEYILKTGIESFLVLGIDKYKGETSSDSHESGSVQADFLLLFVFDNNTKKSTAIHINRDTMTNVNKLDIVGNKIGSSTKQIALAYNYIYDVSEKLSCRNTADSVSDLLLGIPVNNYLSFTMDSVSKMNDLVGGVELTVLDDFGEIDESLIKGEKVTLMGEQALHYVRTRYGLEDSSNSTRMERQQQYINALYDKIISRIETDDEFTLKMVEEMSDFVSYNSTDFQMKEFVDRFEEYEFLGIKDIEGESKLGEKFIEFYPEEESIWNLVIELFYTPKMNDNQ